MCIPPEKCRLEILQMKTRDMPFGPEVVTLRSWCTGPTGSCALQQLCTETVLQCIWEQMGAIDFNQDWLDKNVLNIFMVEMQHSEHVMGWSLVVVAT